MKTYKKTKMFILIVVILMFLIWVVTLKSGKKPENFEYGVTFSYPYAKMLGLDWRHVYKEMLYDLRPSVVRIPVYWNEVERERGKYNFDDVDFQVKEAQGSNVKVVLAIGRRLPRWPECHDPLWLKDLPKNSGEDALLQYLETTVMRYSANTAVEMWQVENEPFLGTFGECPPLNKRFYDSELALVKRLDPGRKILVTDSGELSLWFESGSRGDVF